MKQTDWFKRERDAYGGDLLTTRKERARPRPLSTKDSMHLVLRSSQATGAWSFRKHATAVERLIYKYATKYGVKIYAFANVGNHLHIHLKLGNRFAYPAFIRTLTAAITFAVTKASKLKRLAKRFWDRRPYTRIIRGRAGFRRLTDYVRINQYEGGGWPREQAVAIVKSVSK